MQVISWEKFKDYIQSGNPTVCPIGGSKDLSLIVGLGAGNIALRIPYDGNIEPGPHLRKLVHCRVVTIAGKKTIELSTDRVELFQSFYHLICAIADLIETQNLAPPAAIDKALDQFGRLLIERALLPETTRIGLFGELCFLSALLKAHGDAAIGAWLGPIAERHDFRIGEREFEVKSTIGKRRVHFIHGQDQLEASLGKKLFIVSFHLERAGPGAGMSLPQKVASVRQQINAGLAAYETQLVALHYQSEDEEFYTERYQCRAAATLIPVDGGCPRITRDVLSKALDVGSLDRIVSVDYEINVEGLGYVEGSALFNSVLPGLLLSEQA